MSQQGIPNGDSVPPVGDPIPMVTLPSQVTANASPSDVSLNTTGGTICPSANPRAPPTGSPTDVSQDAPQGPDSTSPIIDNPDGTIDSALIACPPSFAASPITAAQSPAALDTPHTTVPQLATQTPAPQPTPHSPTSSTHDQPQTAPASSPSTSTTSHPSNTVTPPIFPVASPPSSPTVSTTPAPTQPPGILTGAPFTPNGAPLPSNVPTKASPIHAALTDGLLWSVLWAMLLFMFVSLLTWQAKSLDWPLANLSISTGIFLLTILAKLTDWALDSLGNLGWEKLYWGPILHRNATLLTHLVMTSGLAGWWVVLRNPPENGSPSPSRLVNLLRRGLSARWPRFWAFWRNTTLDKSISWATSECRVYQAVDSALQICAKDSNKGGSILTGIRACDPGKLDDEGDCSLNPQWPGWDSFVAFSSTLDIYRLNISMAADRRSSAILEVTDKGKPTKQDIHPSEFLDAFDNLFCPFTSDISTISRYCETGQVRSDVTLNLWMFVYYNYQSEGFENSVAVDTLRNIYATALFLYNPVFRGAVFAPNAPAFLRTAQEGLADENYFPGTPARRSSHLAPALWTVLAFTVSVGFLISASLLAIFFALWFKQPQLSAFGPLNAFKADIVQFGQAGSLDLDALVTGKTDKEVALATDGICIRLR
ncbi:predicted protein [Verticillium alfalfae VaMs.102]|uniref:Predicted protein n=1 Tax=Verticillium alfalfae (strain VaMs.102 / ATCC MYA-4576 / FGSC 10136) TaxID=526221 RepID=C9SW68_VERA1|nr:predicted protein [Verticillium alfalfae VaMs.102]EEY23033.1 predicted protein [Verticillium alfalfae VaMs.102]